MPSPSTATRNATRLSGSLAAEPDRAEETDARQAPCGADADGPLSAQALAKRRVCSSAFDRPLDEHLVLPKKVD